MVITLNGAYFCTKPIPIYMSTDMCTLNLYQLICSISSCILLIITSSYVLYKFRWVQVKVFAILKWESMNQSNGSRIYWMTSINFRDKRNFFLYHNQRACVLIVLFVMNSIEVARSFLSHEKLLLDKLSEHSKHNESGIYYVIPPFIMANALAGFIVTVCLVFHNRILEIKNLPSECFLISIFYMFFMIYFVF